MIHQTTRCSHNDGQPLSDPRFLVFSIFTTHQAARNHKRHSGNKVLQIIHDLQTQLSQRSQNQTKAALITRNISLLGNIRQNRHQIRQRLTSTSLRLDQSIMSTINNRNRQTLNMRHTHLLLLPQHLQYLISNLKLFLIKLILRQHIIPNTTTSSSSVITIISSLISIISIQIVVFRVIQQHLRGWSLWLVLFDTWWPVRPVGVCVAGVIVGVGVVTVGGGSLGEV
mmetsp:Transcript_54404/g.62329  ORF Transcript_54404/g.62329 Transcript_54404/m.62329 type:complete len:226 (-) Transcript_54404:352-1029(-)